MIDPIVSLAFSIHSNPGVYALLLGSGVSRSAGIPTGWEVVLDLIRKLATLEGKDCEPDPVAWYKKRFGEDPDYSKLLDDIVKSPTERSQLHKSYFEPTEEEREEGLKIPSASHKAIAELVKNGYIKVIITTNFDRLLEKSLEDIGLASIVISTSDAVEGAIPLIHSKCTIIKVNGDYLDTRIKITSEELSNYDSRTINLLDRVFDEFGLIVCGWSSEWDTALRAALERCKNLRFTTYWTAKEEITESAKKLVELRRAQVISIQDADFFFSDLLEKVSALQNISKPHPLSVKAAVASLKKYIVDSKYNIRLNDLVMGEVEKLYGELTDEHFPVQGVPFGPEELFKRVQRYEALTEISLALMVNGCYWGEEEHEGLFARCLERIANPAGGRSGTTVWLNLRLYPALLLLYGGGIASLAAKQYKIFSALLTQAKIRDGLREEPLVLGLYPAATMEQRVQQQLPGMGKRYTPLCDHLYEFLRNPLREILPDDTCYQKCFDRFEYLLALVHVDLRGGDSWGPVGNFAWRYRHDYESSVMKEIELEASHKGSHWPLLQVGLFEGTIGRFKHVKSSFDEFWKGLPYF